MVTHSNWSFSLLGQPDGTVQHHAEVLGPIKNQNSLHCAASGTVDLYTENHFVTHEVVLSVGFETLCRARAFSFLLMEASCIL